MLFKKKSKKNTPAVQEPVVPEGAAAASDKGKKVKKKWDKKRIIHFAVLGALIFGIFVMAFPSMMDAYNIYITKKAAENYVAEVEEIEPEDLTAYWEAASAYNEMIQKSTDRWHSSDEEHAAYESALNYSSSGIMGYIECEKIGLKLPFYHGTDAAVLQVAAGHLEGSSLPTGELGNHVVLSGHTGLASAELFNNVDQLEIGDKFVLTVLDQTFTYEVDQITIVDPSDLTKIEFDEDQDYVTLETCTPYGINSHRLLVRGHRVENEPEKTGVEAAAQWWETMLLKLKGMIEHEPEAMIIIGIVVLLVLVLIIKSVKGNSKAKNKNGKGGKNKGASGKLGGSGGSDQGGSAGSDKADPNRKLTRNEKRAAKKAAKQEAKLAKQEAKRAKKEAKHAEKQGSSSAENGAPPGNDDPPAGS